MENKLEFRTVQSDSDITELISLAHRIWNVHYPPIIGEEQVEYMLGKMYTLDSMKEQISSGHIFTAAYADNIMKGFLSFSKTGEKQYMIHKWYVDTALHGKGIGRGLFEEAFRNIDFDEIRLTVNRQNIQAINFYFRFGFTIEKVADFDIGEGFYMNDFVMLFRKRQ